MDIAIIILLIVLIVGVAGVTWYVVKERRDREQQDTALREELSSSLTKTVGERLDSTTMVFGDVQKGLGQLLEATKQVYEVGKDISSLQEILRPPKLRGGFGELLLEELLKQILPPAYYKLQHEFKSGEKVDAIIRLSNGLVPVDSKFPLEDFQRLSDAQSEEEQKIRRRDFVRNIKGHIDKVTKYIQPDEDTFDFALMYIPAENIYYEIVTTDEGNLHRYALEKKVIPVSPNSFYAYLQAIALGLKGLRIEESAREIIAYLGRLQSDFQRFQEDFQILGRHLSEARSKHDEADRKLGRFSDKLQVASTLPTSQLPQNEEESQSMTAETSPKSQERLL